MGTVVDDEPLNGRLKSGADTRNLYAASMGAPRFSPYLFRGYSLTPGTAFPVAPSRRARRQTSRRLAAVPEAVSLIKAMDTPSFDIYPIEPLVGYIPVWAFTQYRFGVGNAGNFYV